MTAPDRAADEVRALVSGLPSKDRARRHLMVWQAYVDDSGNQPSARVYVLGGFLAPYAAWEAFSDEWQAVLDRPHPSKLAFYKFTQSRGLKQEFSDRKGWTPALRDERVLALAQVVKTHAPYHLTAAVRHSHFEQLVHSVPVPTRSLITDHPYHSLLGRAAGAVATIALNAPLDGPIDCIVDEQSGFEPEAHELWRQWRAALRYPDGSPMLGNLLFHDEIRARPLQAADMLAGCARHYQLTGEVLPEFDVLMTIQGMQNDWTGNDVRDRAIEMLLMSERATERDPAVALHSFDRKTARRLRKKARREKKV